MKILAKSIGKTLHDFANLESFVSEIISHLEEFEGPSFLVLPEYAWGDHELSGLQPHFERINQEIGINQVVVAGSVIQEGPVGKVNTAVIISKNGIKFAAKTNVLAGEMDRHSIIAGDNDTLFSVGGLKFAVVVCADIWNNKLLGKLISVEGADLLLVPAFTVVPPGYGPYAKVQWQSLTVVRSREFLVPIVVADHHRTYGRNYGVGGATSITDPSRKHKNMVSHEDFIELPREDIVREIIDLDKVKEYRTYRKEKGILKD